MEEIQIDDVQKMLDEIMDDHVFSVRGSTDEYHKRGGACFKRDCTDFLYGLFSDIENEKD